jgi:hypothetical protein
VDAAQCVFRHPRIPPSGERAAIAHSISNPSGLCEERADA